MRTISCCLVTPTQSVIYYGNMELQLLSSHVLLIRVFVDDKIIQNMEFGYYQARLPYGRRYFTGSGECSAPDQRRWGVLVHDRGYNESAFYIVSNEQVYDFYHSFFTEQSDPYKHSGVFNQYVQMVEDIEILWQKLG